MLERCFLARHNSLLWLILSLALITIVDKTNFLSYFYTTGCLALYSFFVAKGEFNKLFFYFNCYFILAIIFTLVFKEQFPLYLGMTGPEGKAGTDDCRFFAQIVGGENIKYVIKVSLVNISNYAKLLKLCYPFHVYTPLNIVTFTLLFSTLLPYYYEKLALEMFGDEEVAALTGILVFLCPFTTYFGCIIMRDIFTAMLVGAGLYYFQRKLYLPVFFCFLLIAYVRLGTCVFLAGGILISYRNNLRERFNSNIVYYLLLFLLIILFVLLYGFLQSISEGKLSDHFVRDAGGFFEGSTIGAITKLPFPINVIGGMLFFIFIPFLSFDVFTSSPYVSSFFQGFLTPIFMFFLWIPIFYAFLSERINRNAQLKTLILWILYFAVMLGTVSLQSRHKTVLFPMLCMIAAYGKYYGLPEIKNNAHLLGILLVLVQLAFALKTL